MSKAQFSTLKAMRLSKLADQPIEDIIGLGFDLEWFAAICSIIICRKNN